MTYIYDVECKTFIQDDEEICYIKVKYIMVYLVINQVVGGITLNTFLIRQSITNPFTYIYFPRNVFIANENYGVLRSINWYFKFYTYRLRNEKSISFDDYLE